MHGDDRPDAIHLGAFDDAGALVGTGVIMSEPYPLHPHRAHAWQLRGMAVEPDRQGRHIGAELLAAALTGVEERGGALLWCTARSHKIGFYERHGFAVEGAEFIQSETGIPHFHMWRNLGGPPPRPS